MNEKFLLLLLLPFILFACGSDEPENTELFHLSVTVEPKADIVLNPQTAEINFNPEGRSIKVELLGNFDSFIISSDIPQWLNVSTSENVIIINVPENSTGETRAGKIVFDVYANSESQSGYISIIQSSTFTLEELKDREKRAIDAYLSNYPVVETYTEIADMNVGQFAPFYKLDEKGLVYMQIESLGNEGTAVDNDKIYFRFNRYDLISYLKCGSLPKPWGNMSDINFGTTFFVLGSSDEATSQWGTAISLPMLLGLPYGSEVNLVVASEAGMSSDASAIIPALYNIRYYKEKL